MLPPVSPAPPRFRAALAVALAGALWGINGVVSKSVFNARVDPLTLLQARLLLSSVILGAGLLVWRRPQLRALRRADLPVLAAWAFLGLVAVQATYLWAVSLGGVAHAIFMQYTAPLFTALWARCVNRERLRRGLVPGIALCMAGMTALVLGGGAADSVTTLAVVAGVLSSLAGAGNSILGKRAAQQVDPPVALGVGLALGFLATLLVRNPFDTFAILWPGQAGQVLYIATGATVVPFLLFLVGLRALAPTDTILLAMLEPVVAAGGAWLVLGERLELVQVLGGGLLLVGVAVAERGGTEAPAASSTL